MLRTKPLRRSAAPRRGRCPACEGDRLSVFLDVPAVPVHCNLLWPDRESALAAPRGDIRLAFCDACGLVSNTAFDPTLVEYSQRYENSLHFSPRFREYARDLVVRLVERFDLRGKRVVEIGAGDGDFLRLLCREGGNRGLGFDPGYDGPGGADDDGVTIVPDFYSEAHPDEPADFVCCRHVLEHIERPREFLASVRRAIGERETPVYFEVPDFNYTLRDLGIWDIIYEHCTNFTAPSLRRLFAAAGFAVSGVQSTFGGQFLGLEATAAPAPRDATDDGELERLGSLVASFGNVYRAKLAAWNEYLAGLERDGRGAVVWGAGSKGVTFLNLLESAAAIDRVVDINPRKHGMHVAGAGTPIVPPEALREDPPDVVLVMNPIYEREVRHEVDRLRVRPDVLTV